jgi:hypothetical protein
VPRRAGFEVVPDEPGSRWCVRPGGRSRGAELAAPGPTALALDGEAWVSTTKIRGATYLRAGIVNYLSTEDDVDRMLEALRRLSAESAGNSRT